MKFDFYKMQQDAFSNRPTPDVFFESKTHAQGWQLLLKGISSGEPYMAVVGEYGMGKTQLCLMLVRELNKSDRHTTVYIPSPSIGFAGIINEIARVIGLSGNIQDPASAFSSVQYHFTSGRATQEMYLILDDAHELTPDDLCKLRSLVDLNYNSWFPIRVIVFAHPLLFETLKTPALVPLDQRFKIKYRLNTLGFAETKEYIYFRLFKSGAPGVPTFTNDALHKIFSFSKGVPRLINNLCEAVLISGAAQGLTVIDAFLVKDAVSALESGDISPSRINSDRFANPMLEVHEEITGQVKLDLSDIDTSEPPPEQKLFLKPRKKKSFAEKSIESMQSIKSRTVKIRNLEINTAVFAFILLLLIAFSVILFRQYVPFSIFSHNHPDTEITFTAKKPSVSSSKTAELTPDDSARKRTRPATRPQAASGTLPPLDLDVKDAQATAIPSPDPLNSIEPPAASDSPDISNADQTDTRPAVSDSTRQADTPKRTETATESAPPQDSTVSESVAPGSQSTMPARQVRYPYAIRLNCFKSEENARDQLAELRKKGLPVYCVRVDLEGQGIWWRLYLGHYKTYADAKRAARMYDLSDILIKKTPYANLVGSYMSTDELDAMSRRLQNLGYSPYSIDSKCGLQRLFVGAFITRSGAENCYDILLQDGIQNEIVLR